MKPSVGVDVEFLQKLKFYRFFILQNNGYFQGNAWAPNQAGSSGNSARRNEPGPAPGQGNQKRLFASKTFPRIIIFP